MMGGEASRRANTIAGGLGLLVLLATCGAAGADPNLPLLASITQYGITWNFSQAVPVG